MGGKCFGSDDELKNAVNNWINALAAADYNKGILKIMDTHAHIHTARTHTHTHAHVHAYTPGLKNLVF